MNFRTTILLAVVLAALGGMYLVSQNRTPATDESPPEANPLTGTSEISLPVFDGELGDVVRITCKPQTGEEWVFERREETGPSGQPEWQIQSPVNAKAISWEVQRFATQLSKLKYEISYEPGGTVTADTAGLNPPNAVVTLADSDGKTATFEIGHDASPTESYVRLAGSDRICLGQGILSSLVKSSVLDYRDRQLWSFNKDDAVKIEVTDRTGESPVTYVLSRTNGDWVFESPISARATGKIVELVRTLGILRVNNWVDDREDRMPLYGLDPAGYTIRITTEKTEDPAVPEAGDQESETEDPAPSEPVIETNTYVLHVSQRSPIGEDTRVYVRAGDETATGTIMRTLADRFTPNMTEWRDMKISPVNVTGATRVDLSVPGGEASLIKHQRDWSFENDGSLAEGTTVRELLLAINELKAVSFVDDPAPEEMTAFGFDRPQSVIKVSVPGTMEPERLIIGGFTDQQSRRLVYARRNEGTSVAKVRVADVEKLIRSPLAYRNLSVMDTSPEAIKSLRIQAPAACTDETMDAEFARTGSQWRMREPVDAPLDDQEFAKLIDQLAQLKGESIIDVGGALSAYGLDNPTARLTCVFTPPEKVRLEKDEEAGGDSLKNVTVQEDERTVNILLAAHNGKVFATRSDQDTVFQVAAEFLNRTQAEHRAPSILSFSKESVSAFTITQDAVDYRFEDEGGKWTLATEKDLPLDQGKVDNLLLQIGDLVTARYVTHGDVDSMRFGLNEPAFRANIEMDYGESLVLSVSGQSCPGNRERGRFAKATGQTGVFLLTADVLDRLRVDLSSLEP